MKIERLAVLSLSTLIKTDDPIYDFFLIGVSHEK